MKRHIQNSNKTSLSLSSEISKTRSKFAMSVGGKMANSVFTDACGNLVAAVEIKKKSKGDTTL